MVHTFRSKSLSDEFIDFPAPWDGDESDSESHPSLESDAEAELLDLFDEEEETESGCFLESSISTRSPSVDGSSESYDATVIQNRKLLLLNRQQRQQSTAFRESNSFCTNHANLLSPDLMILVERILNENRRTSSKEKVSNNACLKMFSVGAGRNGDGDCQLISSFLFCSHRNSTENLHHRAVRKTQKLQIAIMPSVATRRTVRRKKRRLKIIPIEFESTRTSWIT